MNAKAALLKMHEIDTLYDRIRSRIVVLRRAVDGTDELFAIRKRVESISQELNVARSEQQDMELESRSLTDRIRESEQNLMSGEMRNPKELEAMQQNIDSMKNHRTDLENRSVDRLLAVDSLQGTLQEKESTLAELEKKWAENRTAIETEMDQRKKEYIYLKKARRFVSETLTSDNLELYEHLRRRKNGVAVAQLEGEVCGACHTEVAIGILNNVRYKDELLNCPSCGRILLTED